MLPIIKDIFAVLSTQARHTSVRLAMAIILCLAVAYAHALPVEHYASNSKLAEGLWVKVSVPQSGLYIITPSQLRQWGFSDIAKVKVYGYGGQRIADELTADNYVDDLPLVQSVTTDKGVVFYGVGPEKWTLSANGVYFADNNIYATRGCYFITESADDQREIPSQGLGQASDPVDSFTDRVHYELDSYSPGEAGYVLVGESFKTQGTRKFTFSTPDFYSAGGDTNAALLEATFVLNSTSAVTAEFSINGKKLPATDSDTFRTSSGTAYVHGAYNTTVHDFDISSDKTEITISIPAASNTPGCWLDYIALNYQRKLQLNADGYLDFWLDKPARMQSSNAEMMIWDVTDPLNITAISYANTPNGLVWTNDYHGMRAYAAWHSGSALPSPDFVEKVGNQNLHALDVPEMVIFTLPEFTAQAKRIAQLHAQAQEPINAVVLNINEVYNEFASGAPDVSALRKCLKMLYDRGNAAQADVVSDTESAPKTQLRYALLLGRATYDNRALTPYLASPNAHGTIPCWMGGERRRQFSDNDAFGTDDFIAMLEDGSGNNLGLDMLCLGVGRMPWRYASEAKEGVDKLQQYMLQSKTGTWRNSFLFLADDGDKGVHLRQTEAMISEIMATPQANSFISKVYVDAYDIVGGSCEGGRADMYRMLNEGVVWWCFLGHANNHSWTAENMLNYKDINSLYLNKLPVLMAATCDFLRWDSATLSGGEILYAERYGGVIGMISATRPVYITNNGYFTRAMGRAINHRSEDGKRPRLGDIYRYAKNNIRTESGERRADANRLRFVLMGDPALKLATPHDIVRLESIGGVAVDPEAQVTIMAQQRTTLEGAVYDAQGQIRADFNGTVEIDIYDAEHSVTTKGERNDNTKETFEVHGDKLFSGSAPVVGGRFTVNVAMPGEIADNFREASVNMYAISDDRLSEAAGVNSDFFVFGYDDTAEKDATNPEIALLALNHQGFASGDAVNPTPTVLANISDDIGINLSSAGIGHQMCIILDKTRTFNDVSLYYSPSPDGTPSGSISYPLPELTQGDHNLTLKVWDTSGNCASRSIDFIVRDNLAPTIFDVYADANPARIGTNFFITHDRPDCLLKVTITVSNLLGRPIWQSTVTGRADYTTSAPVSWDLCDSSGRRVPRGIYVYRADVSAQDGTTYSTKARKLAVTAP